MVRIAVASVALSVAVIMVTMAVIAGFGRELTGKTMAFSGEVVVTPSGGVWGGGAGSAVFEDSSDVWLRGVIADPRVERVEGTFSTGAIMQGGGNAYGVVQGVQVMGVDSAYDFAAIRRMLVGGEVPDYGGEVRSRGVLMSALLAGSLGLEVGDVTELIVVGDSPGRNRVQVVGVFSSGMQEFDQGMVFADIRTVRHFAGVDSDSVAGSGVVDSYRIYLRDGVAGSSVGADRVAHMQDKLCYDISDDVHSAAAVRDIYPQIFDWLDMLDLNTWIIMVIMLLVAGVNMSCALLVIVMESRKMIGVLRSQGITGWGLQKIFLMRSCYITFWGMVWGNVVGLVVCGAQAQWGVVRLDAQAYMLDRVPIAVNTGDLLLVNGLTFVVITALMVVPTALLSRIKPDDNLRYS